MDRLAVAVVTVLLLSTIGSGGAVSMAIHSDAGTASEEAVADTQLAPRPTNTLSLPGDAVALERVERVSIAPMTGITNNVAGLQGEFKRYQIRERLARANSSADRRAAIEDGLALIERELAQLRSAARDQRQAFVDRELTTSAYLRHLAEADAKAHTLMDLSQYIETEAARIDGLAVQDQVTRLQYVLQRYSGGVRAVVGGAIDGVRGDRAVYLAAGDDGLVLSTIVDGVYVREVYYGAHRASTGDYQIETIIQASEAIRETYPWIWNESTGLELEPTETPFFPVGVSHTGGELRAHLDRRTGEVFYEVQRIDAAILPTETTVRRAGRLRIVANSTYVGGPVSVRVLEDDTGRAVDAAVAVDGRPVGRTGADGRLLTLAPRVGGTITVTSGATNATVSLPVERP